MKQKTQPPGPIKRPGQTWQNVALTYWTLWQEAQEKAVKYDTIRELLRDECEDGGYL